MKINWIHRLCALICVLLISGIDVTGALKPQFKVDGITGDSTHALYADHVELYGYNHEVLSPIDLATGQTSGRRQHRPFKILKRISRNSSQFANAWVRNESIRNAELKVFAPNNDTGETDQTYRYRFTNIRIVSIRDWIANATDPATANQPEFQEISFVYESVEWQSLPDGPVVQDTWTVRP